MLNRFATLAAVCLLVPVATAPLAAADPNPGPPPPDGVVSADPAITTTPDGWVLTALGRNETQLPVPPLTTALSTREYLVSGTFTGSVRGAGRTKLTGGTLEVGYQIGCGIILDRVEPQATLGFNPAFNGATGANTGFSDANSAGAEVELFPGNVLNLPVTTAKFKDTDPRVTVNSFHINIDGCVGQSFLRSYAKLTSSTADTDDVVAYYGVSTAV